MATTIAELDKALQAWAVKETQKMQVELHAGIKQETPVDTGRAQAGWTNTPVNKVGDIGHIDNEVPYIGWLEFGTDRMAPFGMVRRNINKVVSKR